jgi:hypothetical protein
MSNKITTQSYFIKRLKDSGYVVYKIFDAYGEVDPRNWTIMIDPGVASVYCTCYVNNKDAFGETYFEFYDGGQFLPEKFKLKTDSIEVIIAWLVKYNINNKSIQYTKNDRTLQTSPAAHS